MSCTLFGRFKWYATLCVDMRREIPQTGAPIATEIIEETADRFGTDSETVQEIVDETQVLWAIDIDLNREQLVIGENEDIMITLSEWSFNEEANQLLEDFGPTLDIDEELEDEVSSILSHAHHAAFDTAAIKSIVGYDSQDVTGATSTQYPRIIRKPVDAKPTTGAVDVEYRIQYEHGYKQPFYFVVQAHATVTGEYGTLNIERTYRAIPDGHADEPNDELRVSSDAHHVESDTMVNGWIETYSLSDQFPHKRGRFQEDDDDLRRLVYDNHTANFEQEYRDMQHSINICEECGAFPDGHDVHVEQRSTNLFDQSVPDEMCNHCYAQLLTEMTALSTQEAEVYALKESGLSHRQVADSLGGLSKSQVGTVMGRIRDKKEQSERTAELINVE